MGTVRLPVLNETALPDSSGYVYQDSLSNQGWSNRDGIYWVFADQSQEMILEGSTTCDLAGASISSAKLHIKWASIATSGDASFLFKYRAIDDSEGTDQATFQETFTAQTQTVDGTSKDMNELEITLTNFSSNAVDADHIEFEFGRDGDSSDTLADEAVIFDCYIEVTTS